MIRNIIQRGDIVLRLTDLQNDKEVRKRLARENGIITGILNIAFKNLEITSYISLHTYDICKSFITWWWSSYRCGTWSIFIKCYCERSSKQKLSVYPEKTILVVIASIGVG